MSAAPESRGRIELFDPGRHDRAGFSCGVDAVDNFFQRTANKLANAGNIRLYVMVCQDGGLIGFYALNAHAIDYRDLPTRFARTRPGHGSIPAAYISMIGVDLRYQGQGYGGDLLVDALKRVAQAADTIGIAVAILDVLNDGDALKVGRRKALYKTYGFQALASNPLRLFLPLDTVRRLLAETGPASP